MKIFTLNTWNIQGPWRERTEIIYEFLEQVRPEIAGFQEVFDISWAEKAAERMGAKTVLFESKDSGLTILSKYPCLFIQQIRLKSQSHTEDYSRFVLFGEFDIRGEKLAVFDTHLSWKPEEGSVREAQVGELLEFMDSKGKNSERVVMGDFNAPPDTSEIKKMSLPGGYQDCYGKLHPREDGFTWHHENLYSTSSSVRLPDRRIDYLFTKNEKSLLKLLQSAEVVLKAPNKRGVFASDHYGLLAGFGNGETAGGNKGMKRERRLNFGKI